MKRKITTGTNNPSLDREINVIPLRYVIAIIITILEVLSIISIVALLALYVPYFYVALWITECVVVIFIVVSNQNPDYKLTWLFVVVAIPLVGLMLFIIFHKRRFPKKTTKKLMAIKESYSVDDKNVLESIYKDNQLLSTDAKMLCDISSSHAYKDSSVEYFTSGSEMLFDVLIELKRAKKFIFLEYFIIEEGEFWNSILDVLIEKSKNGVEVRLVYDDVGCMGTLPGNYYKKLQKNYGINAVPFYKLKGQADNEFNNRSHRKILIIDGVKAYTGGINVADEYINKKNRFGHWKDTGIKVTGNAVNEFTKLFLSDYYLNVKGAVSSSLKEYYVNQESSNGTGYIIPFGDAPKPIYDIPVAKYTILNMLSHAKEYVYITTPYLIIDNELTKAIQTTALRGVDVRIIVPGVPDKKIVYGITKNNCRELEKAGVKIYKYLPGFIHAKTYLSDDSTAILGTVNLDYRSLTHHFENGVWIYKSDAILDVKKDFIDTLDKSERFFDLQLDSNFFVKIVNVFVKIFSPLL